MANFDPKSPCTQTKEVGQLEIEPSISDDDGSRPEGDLIEHSSSPTGTDASSPRRLGPKHSREEISDASGASACDSHAKNCHSRGTPSPRREPPSTPGRSPSMRLKKSRSPVTKNKKMLPLMMRVVENQRKALQRLKMKYLNIVIRQRCRTIMLKAFYRLREACDHIPGWVLVFEPEEKEDINGQEEDYVGIVIQAERRVSLI